MDELQELLIDKYGLEPKPYIPRLKRNAAKCLKCGDIIESKHRHDFVTCSCGSISVDGGLDYARRVFAEGVKYENYIELNEYPEEVE